MDINLREMGVGDLSVGKRVRAMWEAFHGRALAYEAPLAAGRRSGARRGARAQCLARRRRRRRRPARLARLALANAAHLARPGRSADLAAGPGGLPSAGGDRAGRGGGMSVASCRARLWSTGSRGGPRPASSRRRPRNARRSPRGSPSRAIAALRCRFHLAVEPGGVAGGGHARGPGHPHLRGVARPVRDRGRGGVQPALRPGRNRGGRRSRIGGRDSLFRRPHRSRRGRGRAARPGARPLSAQARRRPARPRPKRAAAGGPFAALDRLRRRD